MKPESIFVSIHIPKCAGTSLKTALESGLPNRLRLDYGSQVLLADLNAMKNRKRKHLLFEQRFDGYEEDVYHGHFYASRYFKLEVQKKWVTMVRDPVELVLSYYEFLRRINTKRQKGRRRPLAEYAQAMDVLEFVEHPFFSNIITRLTYPLRPSDFTFVGFVENYGASLTRLGDVLGCQLNVVKANVNKSQLSYRERYPAEVLRKIEYFNGMDLQWHAEAVKCHGANLPGA